MISKIKKNKLYLTIILIFILFATNLYAKKTVRVLIFSKQKDIFFNGKFSLMADSKKIKDVENKSLNISFKNNKIKIDHQYYNRELYFRSISKGFFKIGNYKYRGDLKIILTDRLNFINCINVEEYIKGVLPNEISPGWHLEVLKAQAVAARSFAYYFIEKNKDELYDLTDTTYYQVYKGSINESSNFNRAIEKTGGQVLVYKDSLVQAFFHSACGGHTESAEKVWGRLLPYLKGIPCNYCSDSPYYRWETSFTENEIIEKLKVKKHVLDGIRTIRAAKRSNSGRWIVVKIIGKRKTISLPGNEFRILLGINRLRSTKFIIQKQGNKFIIKGRGWGHGVGFCQWGAKKMAEKGRKYYHILSYYYRGARLKSANFLKN